LLARDQIAPQTCPAVVAVRGSAGATLTQQVGGATARRAGYYCVTFRVGFGDVPPIPFFDPCAGTFYQGRKIDVARNLPYNRIGDRFHQHGKPA